MTTSYKLDDLPDEILLLILGFVPLPDVFALFQICRKLYELSERRSFWVAVVQTTLESGDPLPLPANPDWRTFSTVELRSACKKRFFSLTNLASMEPKYRRWRTIRLPSQVNGVPPPTGGAVCIGSGKYCLVWNVIGWFDVWDTGPAETDALNIQSPFGEAAGNHLASLRTEVRLPRIKYDVLEDDKFVIVDFVVTSSRQVGPDPIPVAVCRATIDREHPGSTKIVVLHRETFGTDIVDRLAIRPDNTLVACLWSRRFWDSSSKHVHISVWNYITGERMDIDTLVHVPQSLDYDITMLADGSLLWYTYGKDIKAYIYSDIESLLQESTGLSTGPTAIPVDYEGSFTLRPDTVMGASVWVEPEKTYRVLDSRGPTTLGIFPVVARIHPVRHDYEYHQRTFVSAQRLDIRYLQTLIQTELPEHPPLTREQLDLGVVAMRHANNDESASSVGTSGETFVWVEERQESKQVRGIGWVEQPYRPEQDKVEISLKLLNLDFGRHGLSSSRTIPKTLILPVPLRLVKFLHFLDDSSTLVVLIEDFDSPTADYQLVHLFEY